MAITKKKRRFPWGIVIVVVIVLGVGGFFGYRYVQAQSSSTALPANLTTSPVTLGDLSATLGASGNVRANQSATLNWTAPGRVGQVAVTKGQKVNSNDTLASLDVTSLQSSSLITAQADLLNAQAALDTLKTSNLAKAQAQQALATAQKALSDAQTARALLNYDRAMNGSLDAAYAELYLAQNTLSKAQTNFDNVQSLQPSDPIRANAQAALVTAQQAVNNKQAIVNWYLSGPTQNDIAQADAAVAVAQAQVDDAQKNWDAVKNGPTAADIATAQAKVDTAEVALLGRNVTAPFSGTITDLSSKVGDLVSAGTYAMRIDDLSTMYVDLQISEIDIDQVKLGQATTLVFDAYPTKTYHGEVENISQIGSSSSGAVNFTVTIKMTDADANVKPGMTASATIVLNSVSGVLIVPNRGIRTQGNLKYVLVLVNGKIETVPVRVGLSNDTQTQVIPISLGNRGNGNGGANGGTGTTPTATPNPNVTPNANGSTAITLKAGDLIVTNPLTDLQKNGTSLFRIPGLTGGAGGFGGGAGGFGGGGGGFNGGGNGGHPAGGGD